MRWGLGNKNQKQNPRSAETPPVEDELAFLRSRTDFDAEEMSSVRSADPAEPPPAPAEEPEAGATQPDDDWAFLRSRARDEGSASVFAPVIEGTEPQAPAAGAPAAKPDRGTVLSAEDHRIGGLLQEASGTQPTLSEEDLHIGDLLNDAMGYLPAERQVDKGQ